MGTMEGSLCGHSRIQYRDVPSFQGRIDHLLRIDFVGRFDYRPTPHNEGPRESDSKPFLDAD